MDIHHLHAQCFYMPQSVSDSGFFYSNYSASEQSICQARASVMVYDDTSKKWVPIKPGQQGFSRINIYHNTANNTFRVVGVKLQDQQVVINYSIVKGLKYNQATPTFHQWRDARQVYGLNFASKEEATTFSTAMMFALNTLSSQDGGPAVQRQNGPSSEDPDVQRRQMMEPHQMQGVAHKERERRTSGSGPVSLPAMLAVAPPVAPPAPMAPMAPPPPPGPPPPATVPPPMPPPLPVGGGHGGPHLEGAGNELAQPLSGLAAALAGAKLRKVARDENSPPGTGVAKNDGNRSSGGSGGGGEGLMQEMNALLARRRKASEKPEEEDPKPGQNSTDAGKNPWDRANSVDKASLVSRVRPVGSTSEGDLDFDRMKQEILDEVVRELQKVKDEIINAIRQEIGRIHTC
ncbi:ena/VASP-like protein isoform X7 [Salmo salar]|uniref:Ena/VASP-like protein n=1 Tax=Salmo salar TaxID=8030 RepID=A0ABM3EEF8_SALSA|nr:ena/VASP-like protein isoform X7 [Salmo salar]